MDRGAWWATVHGVSKSWIQLSMHAPKTSISQVKTALSCLNYFLSNTLKLWHAFLSYRCYQGCILSPCLFNFYAEYILRNAGLEEAQAGIKIAGRNINNLR